MGLSTFVSKSKATSCQTPARLDRLRVLSSVLVVSRCATSTCPITQVQPRRTFWGWGGRDGRDSPYDDRFWKRLEKLEQHHMSKYAKLVRRQALLSHKWGQKLSQEHPWWGWRWGWRRFQSDHNSRQTEGCGRDNSGKSAKDLGEQNWWHAEGTRFDRQMQRFKKEIEADPYKFLFGKSNEWLRYRDRSSRDWSSFCRSFLGYDEGPKKANKCETSVPSNEKQTSPPNATVKNDKAIKFAEYQGESPEVSESSSKAAADTSFEFDPISGRMIPKVSQSPEAAKDATLKNDEAVDIPVKTFKSYRARFGYGRETDVTGENDSANLEGQNEQPEQVKNSSPGEEGLKPVKKPGVLYMSGPDKYVDPAPSSQVLVQEDLDPSSTAVGNKSTTPPESQRREYNFEEIKDDDVDLLRPSNIRAPFYSGKTRQEIAEEMQAKREVLERDFTSYQDPEGDLDAEKIRARARDRQSSQVPETQADEVKSSATPSLHGAEPSTAQPGEQSPSSITRGSESGPSLKAPPGHGSISQQATSISSDDLAQSRKSALPDHLVQEIKDIYESTYGEITPQHRQGSPAGKMAPSNSVVMGESPSPASLPQQTLDTSFQETFQSAKKFTETASEVTKELTEICEQLETSKSAPESSPPASLPATYRVLAYDSSSLQVVIAETTSSVYSTDRTLHPAEVLSRLNNPAKFLPHFAQMQTDGYEIVSGGGDILVFKKVREAGASSMTAAEQGENALSAATKINLAESTLQDQQGLSNEMVRDQPEEYAKASSSSSSPSFSFSSSSSSSSAPRTVHRQETVYTGGPPNWSPYPAPSAIEVNTETDTIAHDGQSSFGRTTRWILLTGFATAATCYAIGVVWEYFRTGGEDGLGPEGFTEFESERRRRERAG